MIIGIDGNEANTSTRVGVGQYAFNIIWEIYRQDTVNEYHLYLKETPLFDFPQKRTNWYYHVFGPQKLWTKIALPFRLFTQSFKLDLFFSPSHYSPHLSPFPTIPTIHDLGYLQTQNQFTTKDFYQLTTWTKHSLDHARLVITVSEFTKNEICRIYNIPLEKIFVVPNGVGNIPKFTDFEERSTLAKFKIRKPYFLYLGTLKPNKNIPFLISAFSKVPGFKLVIAGKKGWLFDNIFTKVQSANLEDSVIFTDYITENEKWILFKNALATTLPSTYEGFGIPALESQKIGTPVIAGDIPAYKEVLGKSAIMIDPTDETAMTKALIDIQKPTIRRELIKLGKIQSQEYTWSTSAKILLNVFNKL